jgi:hypothetical protein
MRARATADGRRWADGAAARQGGWSPTGVPRAGREYKTAVIDFLDRSPTPVRVQANSMRSSYRAVLKVHHDPHKAAGRVLQCNGVWFPAPPSTDWPAHAREVITREVEVLRSAPLYVMSPSMGDVTVAAAQTLTMSDLPLLDEADPPIGQGFLLLPHPVGSDDGTRLGLRHPAAAGGSFLIRCHDLGRMPLTCGYRMLGARNRLLVCSVWAPLPGALSAKIDHRLVAVYVSPRRGSPTVIAPGEDRSFGPMVRLPGFPYPATRPPRKWVRQHAISRARRRFPHRSSIVWSGSVTRRVTGHDRA